nr:hypothetical protein [Tanacetum cinerariifolium]
MSARIAKETSLSPSSFRKRYRSSYETPSPSSSLTLPIRKRYQGTSELVEDTKDESSYLDIEREGSKDEGPGSEDESFDPEEEEEAVPEGQQQAVSIVDTAANDPLGIGYGALRRCELALREGLVPSTFEIGQSSRSMLGQQRVEETPIHRSRVRATWVDPMDGIFYIDILVDVPPDPSPVTTLEATIAIGEDEFLEVGAQLELYEVILHGHTQCLDALPHTLFEGYDRDLRELYTRLRDVRDTIFSQRYRLRSLEREQTRSTVTFSAIWRPVLALESYGGYVDA